MLRNRVKEAQIKKTLSEYHTTFGLYIFRQQELGSTNTGFTASELMGQGFGHHCVEDHGVQMAVVSFLTGTQV